MKHYYLLLLLIGTFFFAACGDDDAVTPDVKSQILISPDKQAISAKDTAVFHLSLQPKSSHKWQITSKPAWLNLSKESGTITGDIFELRATVNNNLIQEGRHTGIISIMTDGAGICEAMIDVYVNQYPDPKFQPTSVHFTATEHTKQIFLLNKGNGALNGAIVASEDWIQVDNYVSIYPKSEKNIKISINRQNQPIGSLDGEITLYYNNYIDSLKLPVSVDVPEIEQAVVRFDTLYFNKTDTVKSFYIINTGNTELNYSIGNGSNHLDCTPNSGIISVSDSAKIEVQVDKNNLMSGINDFNLEIKNSTNHVVAKLAVKVLQVDDSKWIIEGNVVDSEYNDKLGKLFVLTSDPNKLLVCDIESHTMESININKTPKCLSVSTNGKYAVVGHNAAISHLDIDNKTELGFFTASVDCYDIALSDRNWAYFTSNGNYSDGVFGINLSTGEEKTQDGGSYYSYGMVKIDPTGNYLLTDQGSSNFFKYDIKTDSIKFLYSSNYGNDIKTGGGFWFAEDGKRVFTKSKNVYRISETKEDSYKYAGVLENKGIINCIDHSSETEKICAIFADNTHYNPKPADKIAIFDANYLNYEKEIDLPKFAIPDGQDSYKFFKPNAKYCFFNSDGTKYIVVMQAEEGMPAKDTWAIYSAQF